MTHSLVKKAAHGVGWKILGQGVQQAIRFVIIIVLTKLLNPGDFGIFAMVLVFTEFILPLREWGFQAALIQKENIDQEYQSTAFLAICCVAVILYLLSLIFAPLVGWFFNSSLVAQIIPIIAVIFLLSPFGSIQWAVLSRRLDFKTIVLINTAATFGYGIAACAFAFKGFGVWSLVWATIFREFLSSLMLWFSRGWRPLLKFSLGKFRELWSFSISCMGSGILDYGVNYFDNLVVGKFLGAAPLGFYNLAFNTISQPQTRIVSQVASVIFPIYSMIKNDPKRIRDAYLKTVKMVAVITVPFVSILFMVAHDFVLVFYGPKWLPAVLPIRIMCFYGLIRALTSIASPVFLSKGRPDIKLKLSIFSLCVFILCLFFGIRHGIVGVSMAVLIFALVNFFPTFYLSDRLLDIEHRKLGAIIFKYIALAAIIISALWTVNFLLHWEAIANPFMRLAGKCAIGLSVYLALWIVYLKPDFDALVTLVKKAIL